MPMLGKIGAGVLQAVSTAFLCNPVGAFGEPVEVKRPAFLDELQKCLSIRDYLLEWPILKLIGVSQELHKPLVESPGDSDAFVVAL